MKHFLLLYDLASDYLERRPAFRSAHLEKAWTSHSRGDLLLGGALADPADGAMLLFRGQSATPAEEFARNDPYVVNGLVKSWRVREWSTVVGVDSAVPTRFGAA